MGRSASFPNDHMAYNPSPGVIGFLCQHVAPRDVASMRELAGKAPFFSWTFDYDRAGCVLCRLAQRSPDKETPA